MATLATFLLLFVSSCWHGENPPPPNSRSVRSCVCLPSTRLHIRFEQLIQNQSVNLAPHPELLGHIQGAGAGGRRQQQRIVVSSSDEFKRWKRCGCTTLTEKVDNSPTLLNTRLSARCGRGLFSYPPSAIGGDHVTHLKTGRDLILSTDILIKVDEHISTQNVRRRGGATRWPLLAQSIGGMMTHTVKTPGCPAGVNRSRTVKGRDLAGDQVWLLPNSRRGKEQRRQIKYCPSSRLTATSRLYSSPGF